VTKGHTHVDEWIFYCGKRADYQCDTCNGCCGPKDGCQCLACEELTSQNRRRVLNSQGIRTVLSFDRYHTKMYRHYCGQNGDYPCKKCDGKCGPADGCQCSACEALDVDMGLILPLLWNRNGVKARQITVTAGHIHQGEKVFYCGQQADYSCRKCNGQCGPYDGCQCSACAELSEKNRDEKMNALGDRTVVSFDSVHARTYVRYCGGAGMYECTICDGRCGPSSGCQCPSCAEIDHNPLMAQRAITAQPTDLGEVKQDREDKMEDIEEEEEEDDEDVCIICFVNPKSAVLIHGDTGHQLCCIECADLLKQTSRPCPICSTPIDHIIRLYKV